jgi:hypothetical protein
VIFAGVAPDNVDPGSMAHFVGRKEADDVDGCTSKAKSAATAPGPIQ